MGGAADCVADRLDLRKATCGTTRTSAARDIRLRAYAVTPGVWANSVRAVSDAGVERRRIDARTAALHHVAYRDSSWSDFAWAAFSSLGSCLWENVSGAQAGPQFPVSSEESGKRRRQTNRETGRGGVGWGVGKRVTQTGVGGRKTNMGG